MQKKIDKIMEYTNDHRLGADEKWEKLNELSLFDQDLIQNSEDRFGECDVQLSTLCEKENKCYNRKPKLPLASLPNPIFKSIAEI